MATKAPDPRKADGVIRRRWTLEGRVQGVGFRPFVWHFASREGLSGFVRNEGDRVLVELQGAESRVLAFSTALQTQLPPLASVASRRVETMRPVPGETAFTIRESREESGGPRYALPDAAVCPACLSELRDPADRRFRYALSNCTHCGPRFSIIRSLPYDRARTTMAGFPMCPECRKEYEEPADRRFHAQPVACPSCGPGLALWTADGSNQRVDPALEATRRLMAGQIVAIKGIGGFHLAVRATDDAAVRELRRRKKRDVKPFALMVERLETAEALARFSPEGCALLTSPAAPIVLARRRECAELPPLSPAVAPGQYRLGIMLAYTPLHHLLFDLEPRLGPLVMTSGNVSDEPLCIDDQEAIARLGLRSDGGNASAGLADAVLFHSRPIQRPVDDSVVMDLGLTARRGQMPMRRSRGYAPAPVAFLENCPPGLAMGSDLKAAPALLCEGQVVLGQHLGDLEHPLAFDHFRKSTEELAAFYRVTPAFVAGDAHPRYHGAAFGRDWASKSGARWIAVQHHHAHGAALLAEHRHQGPALVVVCDGTGHGTDATSWGGELLRIDGARCERLASLKPLHLPGGDAASRETRRCALGLLHMVLGGDFAKHPALRRLYPDAGERLMTAAMVRKGVSCSVSSGAGRYVDAVAALLGLASVNHHEAFAGQALEAAANAALERSAMQTDGRLPNLAPEEVFRLIPGDPMRVDLSPLLGPLVEESTKFPVSSGDEGVPVAGLTTGHASEAVASWALRFHLGLALAWEQTIAHFSEKTGIRTVGQSGGVFGNAILSEALATGLSRRGMNVLLHRVVPPNDGGLALGQAAVAAALLKA